MSYVLFLVTPTHPSIHICPFSLWHWNWDSLPSNLVTTYLVLLRMNHSPVNTTSHTHIHEYANFFLEQTHQHHYTCTLCSHQHSHSHSWLKLLAICQKKKKNKEETKKRIKANHNNPFILTLHFFQFCLRSRIWSLSLLHFSKLSVFSLTALGYKQRARPEARPFKEDETPLQLRHCLGSGKRRGCRPPCILIKLTSPLPSLRVSIH